MSEGIAGYLGTVTLNTQDISSIGLVTAVNYGRNLMSRPTFGAGWTKTKGGVRSVNFTANGILDSAGAAKLQAAYAAEAPVAFSLQVGEAGQATDGGLHSGNCVIGQLTITGNADGEFEWNLSATSDGTVTFTPPQEESSSSSSSS